VKQSLRTQLSTTILAIVLLTITIISFLANIFINHQFTDYVAKQQELKAQIITSTISQQYTPITDQWNMEYIHVIGMFAMYEGYIIKVYDEEGGVLWDAQSHDMNLCNQIMNEISKRMQMEYPQLDGEFTSNDYDLINSDQKVGRVSISYFGPFFLTENDSTFLNSLNTILLSVGFISLLVSVIIGHILARRISQPILKTVEVTKQIADGSYTARLEEDSKTVELSLLVESINHLAASLETMERLRKQLTEDVAHELRTPITILQSYIEAMSDGIWEPTQERLNSCYDEVERIGKLVGDLERLAKLEGENLRLNKQSLDLLVLAENAAAGFEAVASEKNIKIQVHGSNVLVSADQDRMKQVVANLLTNAIKYSGDGSTIDIMITDKANMAELSVQDNGIGISKEELPFIFERFYRADKSRNRSTGGSGIGLTIVKSIVEAHGGMVTVESEINIGSRFTVALPKE